MRVCVRVSVCVNTCVCWGHVEGKKDANSHVGGKGVQRAKVEKSKEKV